ncbi:MAG: hypothetical protein R2796_11595 [Chitinophagaceae bacterium]
MLSSKPFLSNVNVFANAIELLVERKRSLNNTNNIENNPQKVKAILVFPENIEDRAEWCSVLAVWCFAFFKINFKNEFVHIYHLNF